MMYKIICYNCGKDNPQDVIYCIFCSINLSKSALLEMAQKVLRIKRNV